MGIHSFSKTFTGREIKFRNLKHLTVVVDASVIAYQSALGIKNINTLTDGDGNPTIHINVVIAKCLNFKKHKADQLWVFDFHEKGYINPSKIFETDRRKKIKDESKAKLEKLKETKNDLFSSDDEDDIDSKIQTQERVGFSMSDTIINDIKYILNCFEIPWCESPRGYEAESICALLTQDGKDGDLVWTTDTDAIIYGATQMVRELKVKQKKVLMLYDLNSILDDNDITMGDLRKIAVILGCDHCPKTPRVGPKTVLKKFKNIELTDPQKTAITVFGKTYDVSKLNWNNKNCDPFKTTDKMDMLLNWVESKNFNRGRIRKQIDNALN